MRAALLALPWLLVPAPIATASVSPTVLQSAAIVQVDCFTDKGEEYMGTAFRVAPYLLSVNHVTSVGKCFIDGQPININWASPSSDFSILNAGPGPSLKIDCNGFVKGRHYIAIGFGRGEKPAVMVDLVGTGVHDNGMAILTGMLAVIPGQSGGPVVDALTGKVVGTVNAENFERGWSWSDELKNEPVCKGRIA